MELDNLRDLSDEQLEALALDLEPEGTDAVKEPDAPATSEPEAEAADEVQPEGNVDESVPDLDELLAQVSVEDKAPKNIQQNLTRALQIERDRRREAEKQMSQMLEILQRQQQVAQPQVEAEPEVEEEAPDPFLDPEGFIQRKLDERDRLYRKEIEELKQAHVGQKIAASEEDLRKSGDLDEYYQLVNLTDPNHPFYRLVHNTPGTLDKIYAHPKPAQFALELARNQQMADPDIAKKRMESLREQIRKEEEAKALKKVQELLAKKTSNVSAPRGISRMSSATGSANFAKDIRRMTDAELEASAFGDLG